MDFFFFLRRFEVSQIWETLNSAELNRLFTDAFNAVNIY